MGAQRLDVLLVLDAEALLLVDDHQAEVLPSHPGLQQPMGADHDVDRALGHTVEHRAGFGALGEPGQALDPDREAGHPLGEGLQMLVGQQRGGNQHRDLLAVLDRFECRPNRDLGLAVADVAADHPVHRHRFLHVGLDLGDRGELVDRFGEAERVFHLGLPRGVRTERVARAGLPLGVQRHQLAGDLPHGLAGLGFRVGPVAAAEPAQRRRLATDVAGQLIEGIHWHIELVGFALSPLARRVLQHQVLAPRAADGAFGHLHEPADAVLIVHHQVARGQCQRVDGIAAFGGQSPAVGGRHPVTGQVGFGDDHQVCAREDHTVVQWALEHADDAGFGLGSRLQHRCRRVGFGQLLDHAVRGSGARCDDGGGSAGRHVRAQHREELVDITLMAACRRSRPDVQFDCRLVGQLGQRPPRVPGLPRNILHLVEFAEARSAELLDVDGRIAADRGHRP